MKKRIVAALTIVSLMFSLNASCINAKDIPKDYTEIENPNTIRCTCYTAKPDAVTYSGKKVRYGIIAGKKEWQGMTASIYAIADDGGLGEWLGYFEVLDTGFGIDKDGDGIGSIQDGTSIDVFQPTLDDCYEWISNYGDYVYLILYNSKG